MKNIKYALFTLILSLIWGLTALASEIATVRVDIGINDVEDMRPGKVYSAQEPLCYDGIYYVYDYNVSSPHSTPKSGYSYTLDIRPSGGYAFSSDCAVEIRGAYELNIEARSPERIRVKAKTYPYYVLKNVKEISEEAGVYRWKKVDYASSYEVLVIYEDENGEEREAKRSTSGRKIDLSSYNNGDRSIKNVLFRAIRGSDRGAGYIANGLFTDITGEVDLEHSDETFDFKISTARSNAIQGSATNALVSSGIPTKGTGGGPGVTGNNPAVNSTNWKSVDGEWYYEQNGRRLTGWINPIGDEWYLMGADGRMRSGWQLVDGYWFLLNTKHDGSFGRLLTGWWQVNGKWYYMNPYQKNGMPYGAMFANGTTPDGYVVGTDGAWLG